MMPSITSNDVSVMNTKLVKKSFPNADDYYDYCCTFLLFWAGSWLIWAWFCAFLFLLLKKSIVKYVMVSSARQMKTSILECAYKNWMIDKILIICMNLMNPCATHCIHPPLALLFCILLSAPIPIPIPAILSAAAFWLSLRCYCITFCICCKWL